MERKNAFEKKRKKTYLTFVYVHFAWNLEEKINSIHSKIGSIKDMLHNVFLMSIIKYISNQKEKDLWVTQN